MREPTDRLARLESYQSLPLPLRRALRIHLIHGVSPKESMHLAGRDRNWKRDWGTKAVQTVLTQYGDPDSMTDWEVRLAEIEAVMVPAPAVLIPIPAPIRPENHQNTAPIESAPYEQPEVPESFIGHPSLSVDIPAPPQPFSGTDVPIDQLFKGITSENVQEWRRQEYEAAERERLIAVIKEQEELKNRW